MRNGRLVAVMVLATLVLWPVEAHAYIGPGAGFAFAGSMLVILTTFVIAAFTVISWPFMVLYRLIRVGNPYKNAKAKRVVVLGLDGMDPGLATRFMQEGRLPNFQKLADKGVFRPLDTSAPSMSPVAWSTFSTGVDASRHGIYDFLTAIARRPDRVQGVAAPYTQFVTVPEAEKLLKLFDAAEARAKDDDALRKKVTREKFPVLFTYLSIVNPTVGNIKDMKAYRARMTQFAQVYKTQKSYGFHYAMYLPRSWLKRYFNWTLHDLDRYYATPEKVVIPERIEAPRPVKIENGWEIPLTMLVGAKYPGLYRWKCEPKVATFLYPRGNAGSARRLTFDLELPKALTGAKLSIVGLDDDKPGTTPFTITVNNQEIFNGKNGYDEHKWIAIDYPIPDGLLRKGRNTFVLYNLSEEPLSNRQWLGLHSIKLLVPE